MSIDYAALDAADDETIDEQEDDFMPQEYVLEQPPAAAPPAPAAPARKRPSKRALTEEERLERALAQVETLQQKVLAKREERRSSLIEDLYRKHNIVEGPGDLGEAKRIAELRRALGL